MKAFKIRNSQGLFWVGHSRNEFNKKGKIWKQINHARSAITNASYWNSYSNKVITKLPKYLEDCVIVEFELIEKEIHPLKK